MPQPGRSSLPQTANFHDRGVYAPMTSPALAGSRVRSTTRLELAVAGGDWGSPGDVAYLTVFDRSVLACLNDLPAMTPLAVRGAALMVMSEGLAGRRAKAAAIAATAADEAARMHAHDHLLGGVIRCFKPGGAPISPAETADRAMDQLARQTDGASAFMAAGLAAMALDLAAVGVGDRVGGARIPALLADLQALRADMAILRAMTRDHAAAIGTITTAVDQALIALAAALSRIRSLAGDPQRLAKALTQDPAGVRRLVAAAGWLADGWPWLLGSWPVGGDDSAKRRALPMMQTRLPMMPGDAVRPGVQPICAADLIHAVADNEHLLARAA